MNYKKIFIIILLFGSLKLYSQPFRPKTMYVKALDGSDVKIYAGPSIGAEVIGTLLHGAEIRINSKSMAPVTIDGITDFWYGYESFWIFGAYLSEVPTLHLKIIQYVNASEEIKIYAEPSIDAVVTGTLLHGEIIEIDSKSMTPVTIDGITDYWYRYGSSWVFGGYLSDVPAFHAKIMYVNASEEIKIYAEPSIDAAVTGTLLYGERIEINRRSLAPVIIGGITDYWYRYGSSWVFGGCLSEYVPSTVPIILGFWENEDYSKAVYYFASNHEYAQGQAESEYFYFCKWELNGSMLTLTQLYEYGAYDRVPAANPIIEQIQLSVINWDCIILTYSDGHQVRLVRSR